ncbi:proline-rich protein 4-like [Camellia sinensis]|uniref:proline-rich protein 4-like n=1 Tax=Camellia sinensis TaxID=4442 RepID=UPI0010365DF3|nr:proline-rich protein 4-like [Camellia sinensis]
MKICSLYGGAFLGLWVFSFFAVSFCHGNDKIVLEVVGIGECTDCADSNIQASQAFSGLHVTIDCKDTNGELKTRGVGKLDDEGKFRVSLPSNILEKYGNLKEECFAQLHSASAAPCPAHSGSSESSKIVFKSKTARKHPAGILKFSPATCTSAFLWHFFMHPPLPKHPPLMNFSHPFHFHPKFFHPIHKPFSPPVPVYVKPLPPPIPIYKEPLPPHVPFFEPKPPLFEPHVPIYKPPVVEPPVIYVKPLPPPVPIYNPKPPVFELLDNLHFDILLMQAFT